MALDGKTGEEAWRFFVVPAPGEPGSDTWPKNSPIWQRGGGAVWLVGAADPDLGVVYYVTGNGVPQLAGEGRPLGAITAAGRPTAIPPLLPRHAE